MRFFVAASLLLTTPLHAAPPLAWTLTQGIGVNVHTTYANTPYGNTQAAIAAVQWLGLKHLRDSNPAGQSQFYATYEQYMEAGLDYDLITFVQSGNFTADQATLDAFATAYPFGIMSIEGPNEIGSNFAYDGQTGYTAGALVNKSIQQAEQTDSRLSAYGDLMFTFGNWSSFGSVGNMSPFVTSGNAHIYYQYQPPEEVISWALPEEVEQDTPQRYTSVTEAGYATMPGIDPSSGSSNVNEDVQAKYTLDMLMDYATQPAWPVGMTYIYELVDEQPDPNNTNSQYHFGLFRNDWSAKPAASGIRNLLAILHDPAANASRFQPAPFTSPTLTGMPRNSQSTLSGNQYLNIGGASYVVAKSNGAFDIILWAEPALWNNTTYSEVTFPPSTVTLSFARNQTSLKAFDPMQGTQPSQTLTGASKISVSLCDHPVVVEVGP